MVDFNCRVFGVVLDDRDRVLLLKRNAQYIPGTPEHCSWELVGGGLEHGEEPTDAVVREYREEAGIEIAVVRLYQARTGMRDGKPLLNLGFVCRYVVGEVMLTPEHTDFQWVTRAELARMDFGPYGNRDVALFLSMP